MARKRSKTTPKRRLAQKDYIGPLEHLWVNTDIDVSGNIFTLKCDLDKRFGLTQKSKSRMESSNPKPMIMVARLPPNYQLPNRNERISFAMYEPGEFPQHVALRLLERVAKSNQVSREIQAMAGFMIHLLEGRSGPFARFLQEIERANQENERNAP